VQSCHSHSNFAKFIANIDTDTAERYDWRLTRGAQFINSNAAKALAEKVRFELTDPFESPVFKTGAIDHSATFPRGSLPF
jgi:hypothetical protein